MDEQKKHGFQLTLQEDVARKLDRNGYKKAMRWLRSCRREIEAMIDGKKILLAVSAEGGIGW